MDSSKTQEKSILLIAFFIFQIIFAIILTAIISMNATNDKVEPTDYNRQPYISIKDINTKLPDAPAVYIGVVEQLLAKTVELNTENFDVNESVAEIRSESFNMIQFDQVNGVYYTMIVDIPNLQQSYQIYALYSLGAEDPNPATYYTRQVLCLDEYSEKIYPDFNCRDLFGSDIRQTIVSNYLKYFNFNYFTAFSDSNDLSLVDINPIDFNIDDDTKSQYIQEVKSAVKSLGISPDLFTYKVLQQSDLNYYIPVEHR